MNKRTILGFARNISEDVDLINQTLRAPSTESAVHVANLIGTNIIQFHHENFDLLGKVTTSHQDIFQYDGAEASALKVLATASFSNLLEYPKGVRDSIAQKIRGLDFDEMVRRDLMRAVCNMEWLYNKQVLEFSDELLYSLTSGMDFYTAGQYLARRTKDAVKHIPDELRDFGLMEMKLFLDRLDILPFKTFVLDVSRNRMFKNSGIYAIQVTPLHYPENKREIIHTEVILENGNIHGTYGYEIDYKDKPDALQTDEYDTNYVGIVLFNSEKIENILSGKTDGIPFKPIAGEMGDDYNSIIGAVVCQVLNYLTSDGADIMESPDTKDTYRVTISADNIHNTYREIQKWDCGFNYAVAVKDYLKSRDKISSGRTGTPKKPHVRKAHWHHYWIGSGEHKRLIRKWLPAMGIKMDFYSELTRN